jgi:hypothetical protein
MKSKLHTLQLILILLCPAFQASAQETKERKFTIGIHAGPTDVTMHFKASPTYNSYSYKPFTGLIAGISGQFNFCSHVALHVELNYEKTGFIFFPAPLVYIDIVGPDGLIHSVPGKFKTVTTNNNITLPVSLKFNFIQKNSIRVFVNAGTFINYTYSFNKVDYYDDGHKYHVYSARSSKLIINNYDPGALLGIGTDITLYKRMHLTVEIRDHLNLRAVDFTRSNAVGLLTGLTFQL